MIFPDFDPEIFRIGPIAVRWYALAYIAGIVLGWLYANRLVKNERIWGPRFPVATRDQVEDLVLYMTLGVILGGRLGYMLFYNTSAFWTDPLEIVRIWEGGMSFHGGLLGVVGAFFWVARLHKIDVLKLSDLAAPAIPIGLFFGRIANFVNAELWGRETFAPWGVVFCNDGIIERLGHCPAGPVARHPSQLYEAGLEGVVLFIILALAAYQWGFLKRRGLVTGVFLTGYAIFRMLVETVREPDAGLQNWPFGLTMGIVLCLPMLAAGLYLIARSRGPKGEVLVPATAPADAVSTKAVEPAPTAPVAAAAAHAPVETPKAEAKPKATPAPQPAPKAVKPRSVKPISVTPKPAPKATAPKVAAPKKSPTPKVPASKVPASKVPASKVTGPKAAAPKTTPKKPTAKAPAKTPAAKPKATPKK